MRTSQVACDVACVVCRMASFIRRYITRDTAECVAAQSLCLYQSSHALYLPPFTPHSLQPYICTLR
jgi:hypothetical protein